MAAYIWGSNLTRFPVVYLALNAENVISLLKGDFAGNPVQLWTTIVSGILGFVVVAMISRIAYRELNKSAGDDADGGVSGMVVTSSPVQVQPVTLGSDDERSEVAMPVPNERSNCSSAEKIWS